MFYKDGNQNIVITYVYFHLCFAESILVFASN